MANNYILPYNRPRGKSQSNRQVYLRYGNGCKHAPDCFSCPFDNECHYKDNTELNNAPGGAWFYTDGFKYSLERIK